MKPPLLQLTSDVPPLKSRVAPCLTALQDIDYNSMVSTSDNHCHLEGDHCYMDCCMSINTLCIVITAGVLLHIVAFFEVNMEYF